VSTGKASIAAELGEAVRAYRAAVDDFDRELARLLGINQTDVRCLEFLLDDVPEAGPGLLADRLGITTGAVTTMLDRLERVGYLSRTTHPTDRRKTIVRATEQARQLSSRLTGALTHSADRALLDGYTIAEADLIVDFMRRAGAITNRHVTRLRAETGPHPTIASRRQPAS
jgi:DNA-binding MarR family transcriptional regulator